MTRPLLLLTIAIVLCAVSPVASGAWLLGISCGMAGVWAARRVA